jgi:succinoglycan biosynthesis transport protein ExoP
MLIVNPDSPAEKVIRYVSMVYRQRWPVILCVILGGLVGAGVAYSLPRKYQSFCTFIVEGQTIPDPFEGGGARALEHSIQERIENLQHIILSRTFLDGVISKSALRYRADTPEETQALIEELRRSIVIEKKAPNVVSIVYRGNSPKGAQDVASKILGEYEETVSKMFGEKLRDIIYFLEQEREEYRQRLDEAAQDLARFKMGHMEVLPGSEGGHLDRLVALENQRTEVELSILGKRRELEFLEEQLKRMEPYIRDQTTVNQSREIQMQTALVESMEKDLQSLLLRRTEKASEVIVLRQRLDEAREKLEELKKNVVNEVSSELMVRNPVLTEQENARAALGLALEGLQARKESLDKQIAELTSAVLSIPDQERLLEEKMIDYQVEREKYLLLLKEEHSRKLSKSMADHGQGAKFILLDSPVKDTNPVSPNVPLVVLVALLAGLGMGAVIGLLREWLNQTIRSADEVRTMLALPVLATVPSLAYTGEEAARVSDEKRKDYRE